MSLKNYFIFIIQKSENNKLTANLLNKSSDGTIIVELTPRYRSKIFHIF